VPRSLRGAPPPSRAPTASHAMGAARPPLTGEPPHPCGQHVPGQAEPARRSRGPARSAVVWALNIVAGRPRRSAGGCRALPSRGDPPRGHYPGRPRRRGSDRPTVCVVGPVLPNLSPTANRMILVAPDGAVIACRTPDGRGSGPAAGTRSAALLLGFGNRSGWRPACALAGGGKARSGRSKVPTPAVLGTSDWSWRHVREYWFPREFSRTDAISA
jgi:hypothetical protein